MTARTASLLETALIAFIAVCAIDVAVGAGGALMLVGVAVFALVPLAATVLTAAPTTVTPAPVAEG